MNTRKHKMEWKLAYAHHKDCCNVTCNTVGDLERSGFTILQATVPGYLELELMKAGELEDLYFSTNVLEAQKYEDVHVWYYTTVQIENLNQYLHFEGIDTFADIYVNGQLVQTTDNMFLAYDVDCNWKIGLNEVVVHIKPTMLEARKFTPPAASFAMHYNYPSLYVRKAAHMFGWDIMPRIISSGIWKDVTVCEKKTDKIQEVYLTTQKIDGTTAKMSCYVNVDLSAPFATDYTIRVDGVCGDSTFLVEEKLWHNTYILHFDIEKCKLWWPKNAGEPNLYEVTVTLLYKGRICDTYQLKTGVRTIELKRTEITNLNEEGEFCFKVNGKEVFVLGTNWVPMDAFHSEDEKRLPRALELLDDIGCNMVRCWGGNVYESDTFFDFCDEHGILVWQDFAMGCAIYPDEDNFGKQLEKEAIYQVKRLRNHASLAVWAGDNECDVAACGWSGYRRNPNLNRLTREVLKRVVELHDYTRAYLQSSPYVSEEAFQGKGTMPELHMWGPRDYFKGSYYKDTFCHFASETGYHGMPSTQSLQKFLKHPEKIFDENGNVTEEYLAHATCMELEQEATYAYRIPLLYEQIITLFGQAEENLDDFAKQSQISQAEAMKFLIEHFRINKGKRTGIIWWNLIDGWPQVSDAIVDYYYTKKLAYHYTKRSQLPVCFMFDEPEEKKIRLVGVNDLPETQKVSYRILKNDVEILKGEAILSADSVLRLDSVSIEKNEKEFYFIEWTVNGTTYKNHYYTNAIDIDYKRYITALSKYGMDEFEGFTPSDTRQVKM